MPSRVYKSKLATVAFVTWLTLAFARLRYIEVALAVTERRAPRLMEEWSFRLAPDTAPSPHSSPLTEYSTVDFCRYP